MRSPSDTCDGTIRRGAAKNACSTHRGGASSRFSNQSRIRGWDTTPVPMKIHARTVSSPHAKIEDCHSLHRPNDPGRSRAARNRWSIILFPMLLWIVAAAGGGGGRRCTSSASYEAILFFHFVVTSALFAKKFRGFVCMPHV